MKLRELLEVLSPTSKIEIMYNDEFTELEEKGLIKDELKPYLDKYVSIVVPYSYEEGAYLSIMVRDERCY